MSMQPEASQLKAADVLGREFLSARAKLIELGAALDRMDRASGDVAGDSRIKGIRSAIDIIAGKEPQRAERIQLVFSRPYDDGWRQTMLGDA